MASVQGHRLLFVSNHIYLEPSGGGVQWCTYEYLDTLRASGFDVLVHGYSPDRSLISRLSRRLHPRPFHRIVPPTLVDEIHAKVIRHDINWIAFNNSEVCSIAEKLRFRSTHTRHLYLSHGAEITDELNSIRLSPASLPAHRRSSQWLGRSLLAQIAQRQAIDASICISAEDMQFERWLGSSNVHFLPRQVKPMLLEWRPQHKVIGTVATLDHAPNLHGIQSFAAYLRDSDIQLRLVGGPERIGLSLQDSYPCIHYCGRLSDQDLAKEVASWMAFINPVFCHARGASTKVATALGWGLPVLSTPQGVRGYVWDEGLLPLSRTPRDLVGLVMRLSIEENLDNWRERALLVASLAPSLGQTAEHLNAFLVALP